MRSEGKEGEAICDLPGIRGVGKGKVSCELCPSDQLRRYVLLERSMACISYVRRLGRSSASLYSCRGNGGEGYLNAAM